jgi:hypothetical protein
MSAVGYKFVIGQGWAVIGANLPAPGCWSIHEEREFAEDEAREMAEDFGVEYVGEIQ